jgi:hypothetical protein
MSCPSCASSRQAEFPAEVNIHFRGIKNLDKPGVLVFPKVLVCMDCGFSRFGIQDGELARLVAVASPTEMRVRKGLSVAAPVVESACD